MKTLLVVEDEKMIRRGICTIAKRSGVPIDEILECSNGEDALKLISERDIDVMFTDIRMPKMDGIELVKRLQELPNKPIVVAVSGYDDFSYAVEMMRNGVREYILKPVEREKIAEVLSKIDSELKETSEKEHTEYELGKRQLKYLLTNEPASDEELKMLKSKFDELFFMDKFVVCCTSCKEDIQQETKDILFIPSVGDHNAFIIEHHNLEAFIDSELSDVCVGISRPYHGIENLRTAYKEAVEARKVAFCISKGYTYASERTNVSDALKETASKLLDMSAVNLRLQLVGTDKTDELVKEWDRLFVSVEREQISQEYFEAVQERFIEEASRTYRSSMSEEKFVKLQEFRHMMSFADIGEYRDSFMNWLLALNETIGNQEDSSISDKKMKKAIEYIKENYNSDINMAVVSNYVSMNYSLFSYSFKQYVGMNFVNYLKELRVEEAKKMLAQTDMKVIEISQCVGYDNEKHFMKLFKSYMGVSPSEYRKNMQR